MVCNVLRFSLQGNCINDVAVRREENRSTEPGLDHEAGEVARLSASHTDVCVCPRSQLCLFGSAEKGKPVHQINQLYDAHE